MLNNKNIIQLIKKIITRGGYIMIKRKIAIVCLALTMAGTFNFGASASSTTTDVSNTNITTSSKSFNDSLKQKLIKTSMEKLSEDDIKNGKSFVNKMDDKDFEAFVAEYVNRSGKDFAKVKKELNSLGVTLSDPGKTVKIGVGKSKASATSLNKNPLDSKLASLYFTDFEPIYAAGGANFTTDNMSYSIYSFNRSGSSYPYIQAYISYSATPTDTGTYDLLSVEWDATSSTFYDYSISSSVSLRSSAYKNSGMMVFNVVDRNIYAGNYVYATVRVRPEKTTTMEVHSRYTRTYTTSTSTSTTTANFNVDKTSGPSGGVSYQIVNVFGETSWPVEALNYVKMSL
jgi:hypothetical protein